ncbi:MAG: TonB-dependent receptor [Sinimarinibacterium sp.]|jgi:iron complex outermembrane receptor protein
MRAGIVWWAAIVLGVHAAASAQETGAAAEAEAGTDGSEVTMLPVIELQTPEDAGAPSDAAADSTAAAPPQTTPPPASTTLEEIVVTAQRRAEKLQDVPIAVSAFSRDQVESRGIQRIDDLNSLAPGLQISRSPANTTISQITIRGSSQINPAIYWDPAVGLYLDGVYIGKSQGSIYDVVDLAGVEVLRGPQGTLYGRNTIGGTINLVTREPSGIFGGNASVEVGNYAARVLRASLDLPRIGPASITLGARSERRDGWIETTDTSPVDELNNRHNDGLHAAANLELWDGAEALYRFDFSKTDQANNFLQLYRSDLPGAAPSQERQTQADIDSESFERARVEGHAFTLSWNLGEETTLKSISGYRRVRWEDSLDLDGSADMIAHTQRFTDYDQFSQDLNLVGEIGALKYVGGLFYFTDDGYTNNPQTFYFGALNFDSRYGARSKAWAGYGQLDWQALEPLTLSAGLRYTRETKSLERVLGFTPAAGTPYVYYIAEGFETPDKTFSASTPMASVAWKFNDALNVYLRYAEGFKSGGYNGEYSNIQDTPDDGQDGTLNDNQTQTLVPFKPERQKSLELGLKGVFFDGSTSANLALFHNKLDDLQASIFTGGGAAATVVRNAGKATVNGVELEMVLQLLDDTQLRLNYAWLDASYDEFIDEGPPDAAGNSTVGNQADNRAFVHAPEHSANVVLDSLLFETGAGALRAVVDYAWTDAFYTYPYQLAQDGDADYDPDKQAAENSKVEAYGLLNARLAWTAIPLGSATTLELALWGRNLLDEDTANNFIDFGPGLFQNLTVVNFVEPRSYGLAGILRW